MGTLRSIAVARFKRFHQPTSTAIVARIRPPRLPDMLAQSRVALSDQIHLTSLPHCPREKGAQEPFESIFVFLSRAHYWTGDGPLKLSPTVFLLLFAIALTRAGNQQIQQSCVNAATCLLAFRPSLSLGRKSDLQMHRTIRHLAITGSCSCQTPAGRFPNGGESYATNEDRGLFDPVFEYAHRCIGRGSSHQIRP